LTRGASRVLSDGEDSAAPSAGATPKAGSGAPAVLTADQLMEHSRQNPVAGGLALPPPPGAKASPRPPAPASAAEPKRPTPVQVMRDKADFKAMLRKAIDGATGPKSLATKLRAASARAGNECNEELRMEVSSALARWDGVVKAVLEMMDKVDASKPAEFTTMKTASDELMASLQQCGDLIQDYLDAVQFVLDQHAKAKTQRANSERYYRKRVQNRLVLGGYGTKLSAALVVRLENYVNPEAAGDPFEASAFCFFPAGHSIADGIGAAIGTTNYDEKCCSLTGALDQNPRWGGACARLEATSNTFAFLPAALGAQSVDHPGAAPWAIACRAAQFRFGPQAWPMPGFGCFVATTSAAPVMVLALDIEGMLSKGITLPDFTNFMETQGGLAYFQKGVRMAELRPGSALWVPYGWVSWPLLPKATSAGQGSDAGDGAFADAEKADDDLGIAGGAKDRPASGPTEAVATLFHLAVFSAKLVAEVADNAWLAVKDWNEDHLLRQRSKVWTPRRELLASFLDGIKTT